jgi:hypothetical protein
LDILDTIVWDEKYVHCICIIYNVPCLNVKLWFFFYFMLTNLNSLVRFQHKNLMLNGMKVLFNQNTAVGRTVKDTRCYCIYFIINLYLHELYLFYISFCNHFFILLFSFKSFWLFKKVKRWLFQIGGQGANCPRGQMSVSCLPKQWIAIS